MSQTAKRKARTRKVYLGVDDGKPRTNTQYGGAGEPKMPDEVKGTCQIAVSPHYGEHTQMPSCLGFRPMPDDPIEVLLRDGYCNDTCSAQLIQKGQDDEFPCDCWKAKLRSALSAHNGLVRATALRDAADVCDAYGREGNPQAREYACETADELRCRILALADPTALGTLAELERERAQWEKDYKSLLAGVAASDTKLERIRMLPSRTSYFANGHADMWVRKSEIDAILEEK
jgi:hypothetical protein